MSEDDKKKNKVPELDKDKKNNKKKNNVLYFLLLLIPVGIIIAYILLKWYNRGSSMKDSDIYGRT